MTVQPTVKTQIFGSETKLPIYVVFNFYLGYQPEDRLILALHCDFPKVARAESTASGFTLKTADLGTSEEARQAIRTVTEAVSKRTRLQFKTVPVYTRAAPHVTPRGQADPEVTRELLAHMQHTSPGPGSVFTQQQLRWTMHIPWWQRPLIWWRVTRLLRKKYRQPTE